MKSVAPLAIGTAGALAALVPSIAMWGFTVDDALISVRYAQNVVAGAGWRFDVHAPPSDGVTPLPWIPMLLPLAGGDPLDVLVRAKVLGVTAWTIAAVVLARALFARAPAVIAATALATVALAFPIGAWAASGMETGLVIMLATLAAVLAADRPKSAALLAGLAAAFRPELLSWALVVGVGARPSLVTSVLSAGPFAACVLVRLVAFGSPSPLSVHAKPSDLTHGLTYALAALVVVLTPMLATFPVSIARHGNRSSRVLAIACVVHAIVVIAVGGDWMPYARLLVPIAPSLALVFADVASRERNALTWVRPALIAVVGVLGAIYAAPAGRHVQRDRERLVRDARPLLEGAKVIAALDIGWVSAAAPRDARIVDLAGLTDRDIALLPGGHTSKRIDAAMLVERKVDTVIVYSDTRVVEARIVRASLFRDRFEKKAQIAIGERGAFYEVWTAR
jgi:hypothetical protein